MDKSIKYIIENLPTLLNYLMPGFIYVNVKCFLAREEIKTDNFFSVFSMVFISLVMTFIYSIFKYFFAKDKDFFLVSNLDAITGLDLILISLLSGLISYLLYQFKGKESYVKLKNMLNIHTKNSVSEDIFSWAITSESNKENDWAIIYDYVNNLMYIGNIYLASPINSKEKEIILINYTIHRMDTKELIDEVLEEDEPYKYIYLDIEDIKRIDFESSIKLFD